MSRSSGGSTSIDRREEYYLKAAPVIAADPLSFYSRAERGRRWLERFNPGALNPVPGVAVIVDRYLKGVQA